MTTPLDGRYELGDRLGTGGMGTVHRARDLRLDRDVAVKVLRGERVGDDAARARFMAEARTAGSIHHPGIATVHDVGEDTASDDHDPYIVMQLVEGESVAEVLRTRGTLPVDAVERLLVGVADALTAAHAAGVVHRDVKPANIVLSTDSHPVLVDFGIALGADHEPLTETGTVLGTVDYISPEQALGRTATAASDVYSLGLVAYQCLAGTSPFRRGTSVATALAHVGDPLPPLPTPAPSRLAGLIAAMTAKDPDARPTAAQVRDTLADRIHGETAVLAGAAALPTDASASPAEPLPTEMTPVVSAADRTPVGARPGAGSSRTRVFGGVAVFAVLLLLVGMVRGAGGSDQTVPDVVGHDVGQATQELEAVGATVRIQVVDDPDGSAEEVVAQSPDADGALPDDAVVTLDVASGEVVVPAGLVGMPVDEATAALEDLAFEVATVSAASDRPDGTVTQVDTTGRRPVGSTVTLTVAEAPPAPREAEDAAAPTRDPAPTPSRREATRPEAPEPAGQQGGPPSGGAGNGGGNGRGNGRG